ncbi:MAG: TerD family protein [Moraxella sp.]|nr:TerD family protein [Moraxella sp.]
MNDTDTPSTTQFTPQTLTELHLVGSSLIVAISYQHTVLEKTGTDALLTKLPIIKGLTPFKSKTYAMDIDLSCVVLDQAAQVLDVIWYGNLRNDNQSIRHSGDALCGADNFEQSLVNQEEIHIRLAQLDERAHHLLFFINSHHQDALCQAQKAISKFSDNEEHVAHKVSFCELGENTSAVLAWHVQRQRDDFLLSAPFCAVSIQQTNPDNFPQILSQLAQQYVSPAE